MPTPKLTFNNRKQANPADDANRARLASEISNIDKNTADYAEEVAACVERYNQRQDIIKNLREVLVSETEDEVFAAFGRAANASNALRPYIEFAIQRFVVNHFD